jgi:uncharacterized protein (TIGR01619 family)
MSNRWNSYFLLVDNEPASIFVNLGIAKSAPLVDFQNMAYLRIKLKNPRTDGLSNEDEYHDLIAVEDGVWEAVERDGQSVYVGRNTSSGNRDFYFYSRDSSIENILREAMAKWPAYAFQTGVRPDREWSTYWGFLHPSPEDSQRIGNRDVVDQLLKNGDQVEVARIINHLAIFKTQNDRDGFVEYLLTEGYTVSQLIVTADGALSVEFDRLGQPSQMDDVTIALYRIAKMHNGHYDGWGCLTIS